MSATEILRFIILGDDKGSPAFTRFARTMDQSSKAVNRNNAALAKSGKSAAAAQGGILALTGTITGFNDAMTAGSKKTGLFAKGMAGLSLATGLLEPEMAGLVVAVGGLTSAFAAAGVGLGAYGLALGGSLTKVTKAFAAQQASMTKTPAAIAKYKQALAALTPAQRSFFNSLQNVRTEYVAWGDKLSKPVLAPLSRGLKLVKPLLADLAPIVGIAAKAISGLVGDLSKSVTGGGFAKWLASIKPAIGPAITDLGKSLGHIAVGLGGIISAFAPFAPKMTGGVEHLTAAFAKWGTTLSGHSGFQSLIAMFRKDTPVVSQLLKNLAVIIKNVAGSMAAFSSPSNSLGLLNTLKVLTGLLAKLSANKTLVNFVLQFMLLKSISGQILGPLKGAVSGISSIANATQGGISALTDLRAGFVNSAAAASSATGVWGTVGGKIGDMVTAVKGWTIWSKIAAKATAAWTLIQKALNWAFKDNPIGLVIVAITLLVGAVIYAYKHFKWFHDFVDSVWQDIQIGAKAAWHFIQTAAMAVFNWLKQNWPLVLGIITGPVGLAVVLVIKYWDKISGAAKVAWHFIQDTVTTVIGVIRLAFAKWIDFILGIFGMIIHGAAAAFGWIPGIGPKLQAASREFDKFRERTNAALTGINDRKVNVKVGFTGVSSKFPLGRHAAGWRVPGYGGGDKWPALLEGGEAVVPKHLTPHVAPFLRRHNVPGFQRGGLAGGGSGGLTLNTTFPPVQVVDKAVLAAVQNLAQFHAKELWAASGGGPRGMMKYATQYLGDPYVWGGTTPAGWDCSGFTSWVYHHYGYSIPRTAGQQQLWARPSRDVAGALVFFYGTGGNAAHVGLSYGNGKMINASSPSVGTVISGTGGNTGFGIPPNGFDRGGWLLPGRLAINTTGRPEMVRSAAQEDHLASRLDSVIAHLGALIEAVDDNAPATARGVAAAIGGAGRGAAYGAMYGAR